MALKTHCIRGHEMSGDNIVIVKRTGARLCRLCRNIRGAKNRGKPQELKGMPRTHCKHGHEMTPENTRTKKHTSGYTIRVCATCRREDSRRAYHRDPEKNKALSKKYAKEHAAEIRYRQKMRLVNDPEYAAKHAANITKWGKSYRDRHKDEILARQKARYHATKDQKKEERQRTYQRRKHIISEQSLKRRKARTPQQIEADKARKKAYYETHKDEIRARMRQYYEEAGDVIRMKASAYGKLNRDKIREYNRLARLRPGHKERVRIYTERYLRKGGERIKEAMRRNGQKAIDTLSDGYVRSQLRQMGWTNDQIAENPVLVEFWRERLKLLRAVREKRNKVAQVDQ